MTTDSMFNSSEEMLGKLSGLGLHDRSATCIFVPHDMSSNKENNLTESCYIILYPIMSKNIKVLMLL